MTDKLAIIGMGKMGHAIAELAPARGWDVVARLDEAECSKGITRELLGGADVAVEFTTPAASPANIRAAVTARCPIVVGTTGWGDQMDAVTAFVRENNGALLAASNFSLGVNIFEQIVANAATLLGRAPGFDAHLIETHHSAKKDAPSGTALMLARAARAGWGRDIPVTSVRTGSVPGTHELVFDAPFEQVRLEHVARDRRVFAEGALVAARWLIGKRGVFTMRDVLATPSDRQP
ncbi:MAG TPA: dihydrodipicolinate reductase C-terminal domain-containing protein [Gemmatimonadaceae bacterium]